MLFHHGQVHGIARGDVSATEDDLFSALGDRTINRKHLIYHAKQYVECRLDGVAPADSYVAMQDLLENLGIGDETLPFSDQFLQYSLRIALVSMECADQVHRDIGIDQNHECAPVPYPRSISASMLSISAVG